MLIFLLVIFVVLFFLFMVLPLGKRHFIGAGCFLILAILCGAALIANDTYHMGMKVQKTTTVKPLVSSVDGQMPILLYQPLGTSGQQKIYLYKTKTTQKKPQAIKTKNMSAKTTTTTTKPQVVISEQRYVYKNSLSKLLFGILGNNNELKHRSYTFKVGSDWYILSVKQAQKLGKAMADKNTQHQLHLAISQALQSALQKDPHLSKEQQQVVSQQATHDFINKLVK